MRVQPCNYQRVKALRLAQLIPTIQDNFLVNSKSIMKQLRECAQVAKVSQTDVYTLGDVNEKCLKVVFSRLKQLITEVKTFEQGKCVESVHYDYNKKGDIIRVNKLCNSSAGRSNSFNSNIKYTNDGMVINKRGTDGTQVVATFTNGEQQKVVLEKTRSDGLVENVVFVEGEKLEAKIVDNDRVRFDAYGDANTGEMIFSRDFTNYYEEYTELVDGGKYHRQLVFENKNIVTKSVGATVANHFFHLFKDFITPLNELRLKIGEFLVKVD